MKFKAKLEVEFEFEADTDTDSLLDVQRQGKVFLQTQLHLNANEQKFKHYHYTVDVVEENIGYYTYYVYHDKGYYKDDNGKYDKVDNFGKHTLQWCIDYMNRCRANSSPKRRPVKVLKVKKWHAGRFEWVKIF